MANVEDIKKVMIATRMDAEDCEHVLDLLNGNVTEAILAINAYKQSDTYFFYNSLIPKFLNTKCRRCGKEHFTEGKNLDKEDLYIICECGEKLEVAFFGYCEKCEKFVGHYPLPDSSVTESFFEGFMEGLLNPLRAKKNIVSRLDSIPSAQHVGYCQYCNRLHLKCPECGIPVHFPKDEDIASYVVECPKCGTRMRHP